jgi:hypothetical protein
LVWIGIRFVCQLNPKSLAETFNSSGISVTLTLDFIMQLEKQARDGVLETIMGRFVIAGSSWINGRCSIMKSKAIAILEAMKRATTKRLHIFEIYSQTVKNSIRHMHSCVLEFSCIVCKIRRMLSLCNNFEVKSIKRQANMISHTLTRASVCWPNCYTFELTPFVLNNCFIMKCYDFMFVTKKKMFVKIK